MRAALCRSRPKPKPICPPIFTTVARSWEATLREASVSPGDCQRLSRAFLYPGLELDPEASE